MQLFLVFICSFTFMFNGAVNEKFQLLAIMADT